MGKEQTEIFRLSNKEKGKEIQLNSDSAELSAIIILVQDNLRGLFLIISER